MQSTARRLDLLDAPGAVHSAARRLDLLDAPGAVQSAARQLDLLDARRSKVMSASSALEMCREIGFQMRVARQVSYDVFAHDIVVDEVSENPADEDFVKRKWACCHELGQLQDRGWTWEDQHCLLRTALDGDALLMEIGQAELLGLAVALRDYGLLA